MTKEQGKYKQVYRHLWRTYGQSWPVRISYALQIVARLFKLVALPVALSILIANLSKQDYSSANEAIVFFVGFSLLLGLMTPLIKYVGMIGEQKIYTKAAGDYFSKLITADLEYFNSNLSGYLTTAVRQYVDSCLQLVRALRDQYLNTIFSILLPLVVILWLDVWLGFVALGLSIVQAIYLLWASGAISRYRSESRELYKRNSGHMADVISNILAVRSVSEEKTYVTRIRSGMAQEGALFRRRYTLQSKLIALRELITVVFFLMLLWLTVERMSTGAIDITVAVLVVTYITTILNGIYGLSGELDQHDDFVDKIIPGFEILNRSNEISDPLNPELLANVTGDITFDNVTFSYDNGKKILDNFSLCIPSGQKVGVVGLSGAGKSTLTKLLLRFNDVNTGRVLIDGKSVTSVTQEDLRKNLAYVPQEPLLFHASIKENVLLGKPQASEKEVSDALKMAHALDFVSDLPDKLNSIVGERGVKLSGGQKQRIAIARAVLRHAPIIILDEATSALDSESEQIIKDSFSEILKGKTAIVVAHRLSTLSEMDRIIVIEEGKLVEDGSHSELISKKGIYAQLLQRQQQHFE
jgi:ATP-binding cassette subfamily B protein